ncbi:MAG: leucine-rich repeat domain-containing protein, partial [Thermoguttaceae bacterium]|nr:leucine-rich repeat domain-containing protein [Thermoguttaceae bacterium]
MTTLTDKMFDNPRPTPNPSADFEWCENASGVALKSCKRRDAIEIVVPDGVKSIGGYAFYDCQSLRRLVVPESVESIGDDAFGSCLALESATLPDSAPDDFWRSFRGLSIRLTPTANPRLRVVDDVLFTADGKTLLSCPRAQTGEYVVPAGVESIGARAFAGCRELRNVAFPTELRNIDDGAFADCFSLESVALPDGVENIGALAFFRCTALESVAFSSELRSIGYRAFALCFALKPVEFPAGLRSIGDEAFSLGKALRSATFSSNVESVGPKAFFCCALETATFPDSAPDAVWQAFRGRSIRLPPPANPRLRAVDGVLFTADGKTLLSCPLDHTGEYVVPDGVENIGDEAFSGCRALHRIVFLGDVKSVGVRAFSACD